MIIVGNSHVTLFKNGLRLGAEPIDVHWVGALEVDHFVIDHPAARKVRSLFATEPGWKCLVMGNHDVFRIATSPSREAMLDYLHGLYRRVFSELNAQGRFAWLVAMQQADNAGLSGVSAEDLLTIAARFNADMIAWCDEQGIPVLNPLSAILDATGRPPADLLMADQLHLKSTAAPLYLEAMAERLGIHVEPAPSPVQASFEPENEPEGFCALVLGELSFPPVPQRVSSDALTNHLLATIHERLSERGLELELAPHDDFVDSGLLDSLDLVETYAAAVELLGIETPFDVNLRDLNTVDKLRDYLISQLPPAESNLSIEDFVLTLRGRFDDAAERPRILEADARIASMGPERYAKLQEVVQTVTAGNLRYGPMWFWMALIEHGLGNIDRALDMLATASHPGLPFPVSADRTEHYRQVWSLQRPDAVADLPDRKGRNLVLVEHDLDRLARTFRTYLEAFQPGDDVALHVLAGARLTEVETTIIRVIEETGLDPESIPDVSLLEQPTFSNELPAFLRAADLVLGAEEVVAQARALGVEAVNEPDAARLQQIEQRAYKVTAIISAYNSERFIRGRLEDLVAQTLFARGELEILVIDSHSPQNERAIVDEFQAQYPSIRYLRTPERETVYAAWNRGVEMATGCYVINANTDDRFQPDALELMAAELDRDPGLHGVYGDWLVTDLENDRFDSSHPKFRFEYPEWVPPLFFYYQISSHAALVRRECFDTIGLYDGKLKVYGDRDLMMRFAAAGLRAKRIPRVVGLYLESPTSVEHANRSAETEFAAMRDHYLQPEPLARLFGREPVTDPRALAELYAQVGAMGKDYYHWNGTPSSDYGFAARCFQLALAHDPLNPVALSNLAVILALTGKPAQARELFTQALPFEEAGEIRANLTAVRRDSTRLQDYVWLKPGTPSLRERFHVVLAQSSAEELIAGTLAFAAAFDAAAPVTLSVLAGPHVERLAAELPERLMAAGHDLDRMADVRVIQGTQDLAEWPAFLQAADLVLGPEAVATRARTFGRPAFSRLSIDLLRTAAETFRTLDWTTAKANLDTTARERWLTFFDEEWETPLERYLEVKRQTPERDLVLVIAASDEALAAERITGFLEARGLDPEQVPDIVLVGDAAVSAVALCKAATTYVGSDAVREAIAAATGLKGLEPASVPPALSVVIPCYNYGRFLEEAVLSVLDQTFRDLEIVIVNDGSPDDTLQVSEALIRAHAGYPIRLLDQPNSGHPSLARNRGVAEAQGRYILCLDADDKIASDFLERCVFALEVRPDLSIAYPDVQKFGKVDKLETHLPYDLPTLARFNYITATSVFRRQAWEDVGGFPAHVGYEDWDFWISCGERGHVGIYLPEAISWYRIHMEGTYSKDRVKDQSIKARIVLRHPALYSAEQLEWAQGVLDQDPEALAIDGGLGVVPQIPPRSLTRRIPQATSEPTEGLHIMFTMYGWAEEGGGTILPRQIAKALVRRGHRVTVVYTPSQTRPDKPSYFLESSEEDGVQLFAIYNRPAIFYDIEHPEREADDPHMRRLLAQMVTELRPDIVHYHSLLNFSTGIAEVVKQAGVPSVFTSHNYWPLCPRMYLFQDDLTLCSGPSEDGSKCAICVGRADQTGGYGLRAEHGRQMLNRWVDRHLAVSSRVKELYAQNGHDPERIKVLQQQPETVEWLWEKVGSLRPLQGTLDRPLKVGFIGSFLPQKGVHVLVRALQSFTPDQIEGHFFGSGPKAYEDMLRELDTQRLVKFHGRYQVEQLPELLKQVDVVVIPSIWEDCAPLVVAEALAARCPVIGSRIGGIPDFIAEGRTGFLVDPRNAPGLASALFQFVRDPGLLGRMQQNIQSPRGFDAYLDELVGHYRDVRSRQGLRLVWEGSQFVRHSLALINREVCRRLVQNGLELSILPYEADEFGPEVDPGLQVIADRTNAPLTGAAEVHVRHQWPPKFEPPAEGAWVMIQPWEFGGIPLEWVEPMKHQVDEIWVPTSHVRDGYVRSGIPADKVVVVPNGVDTDRLHPDAPKYSLKTRKRFKFLFVGGTILRKGIDILLDAYGKAFTSADDVCLVIKDLGGKSFYKGQTAKDRIAELQQDPLAPEIEYLDDPLTDAEIAGLYAACDSLVHPYRGEGFALPIAEAMATGLPVIVTGYGACLDFCDPETAYLIPARELPITQSGLSPGAVGYWWAEPDREALADLMQSVVADPEQARAVGKRARDRILSGFTWAHMADRILERLRVLSTRPPIRAALSDPFQPGLKPLPLEDRRAYAFFHHPQWHEAGWKEVVVGFARAFSAQDDVCLVLWLDPSQGVSVEAAGERIVAALAEAGLDPDAGPDLLLVPDALDLHGLARLYAAVDCVVPQGDALQIERAGKTDKRSLEDPSLDAWRAAAEKGAVLRN